MVSLTTLSSNSSADFLDYFVLFYGCDKLSAEDTVFLKDSTQLDSPVSHIQALKDFGNNLFRQQQFGQAGGCYDTACRLLCVSLKDTLEHDLNSIISLAVSLCLNLAACANKLQGFEEALIYCSMVLNFFPRNAKALFRKAIALKKLHRFSEAYSLLEEASLSEPHNKDIIQELEDVRQSLAINKNGKRVIVDLVDANDVRAGKVLVSPPQSQEVGYPLHHKEADMVAIMDEASSVASQLGSGSEKKCKKKLVCPESSSDCVSVTSLEVPMDTSSVPDEIMNDSEVSQSSSSTNSRSPQLRFTNKKRPHNALNLSSQDYDNLLHGKTLSFYHPRSMSYMRVRTLNSKTIQTGAPHEEIYGTAEVPTSSPTQEISFQQIDVDQPERFEVVQEEAILKVDKKTCLNSFKFAAVRDFSLNKEGRMDYSVTKKRRIAVCHSKCRQEHVLATLTRRSSTSVGALTFFCTSNTATLMRMKRKDVPLIEFDSHYHPPFKKTRLVSSVTATCSVSSVTWFSRSLRVANTPLFVL